MRRFQQARSILDIGLRGSCLVGSSTTEAPSPSQHCRVCRRRADMCLSSIFELQTTLKDGVESISSSVWWSKTIAVHVARVRGKEQETRYLARMGKHVGPTQNAQSAQHLISILARNQARRHWVYSGHYPRIFIAPKNAKNAETKHWSGADQSRY